MFWYTLAVLVIGAVIGGCFVHVLAQVTLVRILVMLEDAGFLEHRWTDFELEEVQNMAEIARLVRERKRNGSV